MLSDICLLYTSKYGLSTQFLHAYRLYFESGSGILGYFAGTEIRSELPENLKKIKEDIFKE